MNYKIKGSNIHERNISDFIDERKDKDLIDIFTELKDIAKIKQQKDTFSSFYCNYTPIFLYEVMKKDIEVEELDKILKIADYEDGLDRFFERPDSNYTEAMKGSSIWDKMGYYFYHKVDGKIIADESKFKYVKLFLENVHEKNLLDFHSSRINYFFTHILYVMPEKSGWIFDISERNPILLKSERKEYLSVPGNILRNISDASYDNDVVEVYNLFKTIPLMKNEMEKKIIQDNWSNELDVNLSLMNMFLKYEDTEDLIDFLQRRFNDEIINNPKDKIDSQFKLSSGLTVSFDKVSYDLDCSKIDINKSWKDNYIYLCLLNDLLEQGRFDNIKNISKELINYLNVFDDDLLEKSFNDMELNKEEYRLMDRVFGMNQFKVLQKIIAYQDLKNDLPEKENTKTKFKM